MRPAIEICLCVCMGLGLGGCSQAPNPEVGRAALRAAEQRAVDVANARDAQGWLAGYAEDVVIVPPSSPVLTEKKAIAEWVARATSNPKLHFEYQNLRTEISAAGDLGYTLSHYELTHALPDGTTAVERGRWLIAWRKQPDGRWRSITEIWNLDPPAPATPN